MLVSMSTRRCLGCMNEIEDNTERCPYCGYSKEDAVPLSILQPKTVLNNRYVVGKPLKVDGEGITYIAYDVKMSIPVTIREYMPHGLVEREVDLLVVNTGCEAKFKALKSDFIDLYTHLSELKALGNIRKVYGLFEENNTVYAVCEHLKYQTLNEFLIDHAGELDWDMAAILMKPILESLSIINSNGVIHRGISPETIVVLQDGTLKLIGFSICSARVKNSEILPSLYDGYAAPEQYSRMTPHGEWTDVYAISAVLYKVLTGTMPPVATTRTVNDNLIELSEVNSTVPHAVSKAVMKGLSYDYENRPQNMRQLINLLYFSTDTVTADVIMSSTKPVHIYDENDEEFDFHEDYDQEPHNHKRKREKEDKPPKKKKRMPIWAIVLLICIPIIILITIFLYDVMIGFGSDKPHKDNSSKDSSISSELSSEDISSEEPSSSSEESSKEDTTQMPNLVGNVYSAEDMLQYTDKFNLKNPVFEYNDEYASGQICRQSVEQGTEVTPSTSVIIYVSLGPQMVTLPSIEGKTPEEYIQSLQVSYEILANPIVKEYSDTVPAGSIIRVEPEVGSQIDRAANTKVTVYQSIGPDPLKASTEDNE